MPVVLRVLQDLVGDGGGEMELRLDDFALFGFCERISDEQESGGGCHD
jgi:hypothetical protein